MANAMNCVIISKLKDELYNIRVGIIIAQRNVKSMKRPVPIYDFTAFGKAIKEARTKRGESRKNVSDDMDISPRYLANIENKGQQPSLQIFYELVTRYDISVDQYFFPDKSADKSTMRRQLDITTYQKTKPVYEAYKKAKNKEQFRAAHESDLILYEAAAKALRAANVGGKLPSVATLQAEYAKLTEKKEALYADYGKLKKQVKEYDTMKRNIDSFLKIDRGQAKKKITARE